MWQDLPADQPQHRDVPRLQVYCHFGNLSTVTIGDVGVRLTGLAIVGSGGTRVEDEVGTGRTLFVLPFLERARGCALDGAAGHETHTAGRRAAAGAGHVR